MLAMKSEVVLCAVVAALALLGCNDMPAPNQGAGADCNAAIGDDACVAGHFCARAEPDRGEQQRQSNGGFLGLGDAVPIGRCTPLPAEGEACSFVNRECAAGATCQFEGASRVGVCRAGP